MEIKELLQEKRTEILKIAAQYGASNVRIFGSVARGEAKPDSDIDFLMDIQAGRSLLNRIALIQDLEDLLNRKVDVAKPETLHESIREQILQEATKRLSPEFRAKYPEVPWRRIAGLRDVLIHDYLRVDPDEVWGIIVNDLPNLKTAINNIIQNWQK